MEWRNRKTHWYEAVSSALTFAFLKKSRRIASLLMLPTSKLKDVSQNCFVFGIFGIVNFKTLKISRRMAVFAMLSSSKIEDVSQESFVFNLSDRQTDR